MFKRDSVFSIVASYFIVGIIWITTSDHLADWIGDLFGIDHVRLQNAKGYFFVIATSFLLNWLIKRYHRRLVGSEQQYHALFYSNPIPLWIYDSDTLKVIDVNDAAVRNYGYSRREFRRLTMRDIRVDSTDNKGGNAGHESFGPNRSPRKFKHRRKDGSTLIASVKSIKFPIEDRNAVLAIARDITLEIKHEKLLRTSYKIEKQLREELEYNLTLMKQSMQEKQKLAEVVDRVNNVVLITDPNGEIIWVNPAFEKYTGFTLDEVVGKHPDILHGPKTDKQINDIIVETMKSHAFHSFETWNYKKNGEAYWVELNVSAIYNEEGQVERLITIQSVETARKLREDNIKEYNQALRRLAWSNSHSVRKPVANLLSLVELYKSLDTPEEVGEVQSLVEACAVELDEKVKEMAREIYRLENAGVEAGD